MLGAGWGLASGLANLGAGLGGDSARRASLREARRLSSLCSQTVRSCRALPLLRCISRTKPYFFTRRKQVCIPSGEPRHFTQNRLQVGFRRLLCRSHYLQSKANAGEAFLLVSGREERQGSDRSPECGVALF